MAIKRENKFAAEAESIEKKVQEKASSRKNAQVIKSLAGKQTARRGRPAGRTEKKTLPIYVPMELYKEFAAITEAQGISNNAAICQLIQAFVKQNKE